MSKKQFTPNPYRLSIDIDDTCGIEFNRENKNYGGFREQDYNKLKVFCKELNRLFKENEQLKQENEWLKQSNKNLEKIAYPMQRYIGDVE